MTRSTPLAPMILIADDDRMMRRMLRQAMEQEGYRVTEAEDGEQCLTQFAQVAPDLVLLDGVMPVMDGFVACTALQALPGGEHTPVLIITGLDDGVSVDRAFAAGAIDYITKPIHWPVLRHRVRRVLRTRQAEEALRQNYLLTTQERERLRTIIEASRDGIVLVSHQNMILDLNTAVLKLLGLSGSPREWRDQTLRSALRAARHVAPVPVAAMISELRRTNHLPNDPLQGEYSFKQGSVVRHIIYQSIPVEAEDGLGRVIMLRDVSEERSVQRMREDLTRMMVHDLRNPLAATATAAQMLQLVDEDGDGEVATLGRIIRNNTQRALSLVTNILDVSRLEAGQMPVEAQAMLLDATINAVLDDLSPLAQEKNLHLKAECEPNLGFAFADNKLVERVIRNLIGNSLKFTPAGGSITIRTQAVDQTVHVSVIDTGPGLSPDIQSRLFQKFATGRTEGGGSGLGLAFCKLAVEAMGGRIWAEVKPQSGGIFRFTLPRFVEPKAA